MLSVVEGIAPKDEVEAMLATQMAAVHMASMTFARRLAHVDNIPQQDSAERAFNKLARTFTATCSTVTFLLTSSPVALQRVDLRAPGDAPPCIRHLPFAIAGDRHGLPRRVLAPQRRLRCIDKCFGMAFALFVLSCAAPFSTVPTIACPPAWTCTTGERNANYKHGCFTKEALAERREASAWAKLMRRLAEEVK